MKKMKNKKKLTQLFGIIALIVLVIFANMMMSESAKEYYMNVNGQNEIMLALVVGLITFLCLLVVEKI